MSTEKVFLEHSHAQSFTALCTGQQQSWVAAIDSKSHKPKMFPLHPFTECVCCHLCEVDSLGEERGGLSLL